MSQKLLDVLTLGHCSHEFSWPRRSADGNYYQVCLHCATEYRYDWRAMRRTERMESADAAAASVGATRSTTSKSKWVPRARRLKMPIPLRYRVRHGTAWYEGTVENLSQSGVLFKGEKLLESNTLVEMIFEMPEEISGQKNSNVVCQGQIARSPEGAKPKEGEEVELAASVLDYKFLHQS